MSWDSTADYEIISKGRVWKHLEKKEAKKLKKILKKAKNPVYMGRMAQF